MNASARAAATARVTDRPKNEGGVCINTRPEQRVGGRADTHQEMRPEGRQEGRNEVRPIEVRPQQMMRSLNRSLSSEVVKSHADLKAQMALVCSRQLRKKDVRKKVLTASSRDICGRRSESSGATNAGGHGMKRHCARDNDDANGGGIAQQARHDRDDDEHRVQHKKAARGSPRECEANNPACSRTEGSSIPASRTSGAASTPVADELASLAGFTLRGRVQREQRHLWTGGGTTTLATSTPGRNRSAAFAVTETPTHPSPAPRSSPSWPAGKVQVIVEESPYAGRKQRVDCMRGAGPSNLKGRLEEHEGGED